MVTIALGVASGILLALLALLMLPWIAAAFRISFYLLAELVKLPFRLVLLPFRLVSRAPVSLRVVLLLAVCVVVIVFSVIHSS